MATFSPVMSSYVKSDGTRNIQILIFHNGKKRYPKTNIFVEKDDLTRSANLKNQKYIDLVDDITKKCRQRCNEYATQLGDMTVDDVVNLISDIIEGRQRDHGDRFDLDFIQYGRAYASKLRSQGRNGNAKTYDIALNNLVKFSGRESISVHEITAKFVEKWIDWLLLTTKGRAASLYPSNIRALHNRAKEEYNDEDIGIVRIPLSPFRKVKLPKLPERRERALTIEQVRQIFTLPDDTAQRSGNNLLNFSRDMFMLSFGLVGMNAADLYNCNDYKDGRITYKRTKVTNRRSDGAKISIKVEPEILPLVEKYRDPSGKRVFCFYNMYADENTFSAAINGKYYKGKRTGKRAVGLKKIGDLIGVDDLEFYAARHSWASIAQNDVGIDKYTVHTALNHVIEEMKVTDIYLKKDWTPIDRANRRVLDYVFGAGL